MVTYRGSHRSPLPRLPLRTAERERASQPGPPGTHYTGTCPPFLHCTHLFSFHLRSDHGPIGADDDAGLPFLPLQEKRKHEGRWRDQAPSRGGAGITTGTWWPVRMGTRSVTTPWGGGGPEQLPSTLGSPEDQMIPCRLSVPPGPARRSTEPMTALTHQRQTPTLLSITTTPVVLQQDW